MPHFPRSDWSKQLGAPNLAGRRIGVLREMFDNGPYDSEVKAIFDRSIDDMRKAGAIIVDPVMTGPQPAHCDEQRADSAPATRISATWICPTS